MSEHLHGTFQDWCYRCNLSREDAAEFERERLERREAHDFVGLVATLQQIGGDLENPEDVPVIADELLDSSWFARRVLSLVSEPQK